MNHETDVSLNTIEREIALTSADRLLMLAPHPDDDTLAAGGLLQHAVAQRASVRVLYVTCGENNPWAQRANERRWRLGPDDRTRWGARRWSEAAASLERLGIDPAVAERLNLPDQGLTDLLMAGDRAIVDLLAEKVASGRPTFLLVPSIRDLHPDHNALGVLARFVLGREPAPRAGATVLQYIVHGNRVSQSSRSVRFTLTRGMQQRKRQAVLCHRSQLALRRRHLLHHVRPVERFEAVSGPGEGSAAHPFLDAFIADRLLHLEIARPLPPGLGRPGLLVALEGAGPIHSRIRIELDLRRGRARAFYVDSPLGSVSIPIRPSSRSLRVVTPLPYEIRRDRAPSVFVKLERTAMRRLGFFDGCGWCRVREPWPQQDGDLILASQDAGIGESMPSPVPS